MEKLVIIFLDFYTLQDIPASLMKQIPVLLNPNNPFQNMFECVDSVFVDTITSAAKTTLKKLSSGCESLVDLFYPQNYNSLRTMLSLRNHCWTIVDRAMTSNLMPSMKLCDWIKPVLNRSKERIVRDMFKETRYLLQRIHRLVAAVVLTTELSSSVFSLLTVIENLQSFCGELNDTQVELQYLQISDVEETLPRDVVFLIPCSGGSRSLQLGVDLTLPWMLE